MFYVRIRHFLLSLLCPFKDWIELVSWPDGFLPFSPPKMSSWIHHVVFTFFCPLFINFIFIFSHEFVLLLATRVPKALMLYGITSEYLIVVVLVSFSQLILAFFNFIMLISFLVNLLLSVLLMYP